MVQEDSYKSSSVQYIDSREVAEMVGKRHPDLYEKAVEKNQDVI